MSLTSPQSDPQSLTNGILHGPNSSQWNHAGTTNASPQNHVIIKDRMTNRSQSTYSHKTRLLIYMRYVSRHLHTALLLHNQSVAKENGDIQQAIYHFLLVVCSNHVVVLQRFRNITLVTVRRPPLFVARTILHLPGRSGPVLARAPVVREDPGSNLTADGCVNREYYCDMQLWGCALQHRPLGSLNRVPASVGVRAGMSPLPGGRCVWSHNGMWVPVAVWQRRDLYTSYFSYFTFKLLL